MLVVSPWQRNEKIIQIAKQLIKTNFHVYGDKNFLNQKIIPPNVKIFNFLNYRDIPKTLSKYHIALMPYGKTVTGRLKNINLSKSMSPLKMFDYLASPKIIIASKLKVYDHILKHKFNSILVENNTEEWICWINKIFKSYKSYNYLKINAKKTSNKYTWKNRSQKILMFAIKNFSK